MGQKDIAQKYLAEHEDVFADIINVLLFHGERKINPAELTDHSVRSTYKSEDRLRIMERDIAKKWQKGNIAFCLGIENQTKPERYMPLRVIGYDGTDYRDQLNHEHEPCPVVTLVLYFGMEHRWNYPTDIHGCLNISDEYRPIVRNYGFHLFEIAWLDKETVAKFSSDFQILADYLVQMRETGSYNPSNIKITHIQELLSLMAAMTNDKRFKEVPILKRENNESEALSMCEILDQFISRGIEQGIQQGVQQGMESVARKMLLVNEPASKIEEFTGLSLDAIKVLATALGVAPVL